MRADHTNRVAPNARGRDSIRIHSNKAYADSVTILDVEHMPEGCATWPAFWSLSQAGPWPAGGEIESGLFALQAGLGGLALGYVFGRLKGRRTRTETVDPSA